ncbi:MAG TPA: universal stress protein [Acidimicrobiales bacterium]|nr:universal stress protein [Acidimicrobiales bacterium]
MGATESESASEAVRRAIEVTKASGGTLHIVAAFKAHRPSPPEMPEEYRYSSWSIDPIDLLLNKLKVTATEASIQVATHPVLANPVEAITRVAAQERADLIVVGSKSSHGTRHLSNVPKAIMDKATCAVLVV